MFLRDIQAWLVTMDLSSTSSFEIEIPSTSATSGEELRLTTRKRVLQYPLSMLLFIIAKITGYVYI